MHRRNVHLEDLSDEAALNLTPLIDIVLVVLVCFVLIAPLLEIDQVELARGASRFDASSMHKSRINIYVEKDNQIRINNKLINVNDLRDELTSLKGLYPDEAPQLFQDKKSEFGIYQEVKNQVEEMGFTQLDVILKSS